MLRSSGEISPAVKRHFAGLSAENRRNAQKQQESLIQGMAKENLKLANTVHDLAANLNRIMDALKLQGDDRGSNEKLAKRAQVSSNTIGRMRRGDGSIGIIKLSRVAKVLGLHSWELLYPGVDLHNRPEIVSDSTERALLEVHRRKADVIQH
jgi:transcriptional regulator with XRE-family HTH domain